MTDGKICLKILLKLTTELKKTQHHLKIF